MGRGGGVKGSAVYGALGHADQVEELGLRIAGGVELLAGAAVDSVGDRDDAEPRQVGQRFFERLRVGAIALFGERRRKLRGSAGLVSEQESQRKPMTREVIGEQTPAEPDALWMLHGRTLLFFIGNTA